MLALEPWQHQTDVSLRLCLYKAALVFAYVNPLAACADMRLPAINHSAPADVSEAATWDCLLMSLLVWFLLCKQWLAPAGALWHSQTAVVHHLMPAQQPGQAAAPMG